MLTSEKYIFTFIFSISSYTTVKQCFSLMNGLFMIKKRTYDSQE